MGKLTIETDEHWRLVTILLCFCSAGQLKEAKDGVADLRKQLKRSETAQKKLLKCALHWGSLADASGKVPSFSIS